MREIPRSSSTSTPPSPSPAKTDTPAPSPAQVCARALADVVAAGISTAGATIVCPAGDAATTKDGRVREGLTSWPEGQGSFLVAVHRGVLARPLRLRWVLAHELCHVALVPRGDLSESGANRCAAAAGFPSR